MAQKYCGGIAIYSNIVEQRTRRIKIRHASTESKQNLYFLTIWSLWHLDLGEYSGIISSGKCNYRKVEGDRNFFAANEDWVVT